MQHRGRSGDPPSSAHSMPRVPSFNMDDHRPVFDAQAVLDHESPNAADPPRPMPAGAAAAAADDRAPASSTSSSDGDSSSASSEDEESIRDMALDLEAVADHCDIAIPVLYSELRRAVASSLPRARPSSLSSAASGGTPPARVGSYGAPATATATTRRRRLGSQAQSSGERAPLVGPRGASTGTPDAATSSSPTPTQASLAARSMPAASKRIPVGANLVHFHPRALDEAESRVLQQQQHGASSLARSLRSLTSSLSARGHARGSALSTSPGAAAAHPVPVGDGAAHPSGLDAPLATGDGFRRSASPPARSPTGAACVDRDDDATVPLFTASGAINSVHSPAEQDADDDVPGSERADAATVSVAGTAASGRLSVVSAAATAQGGGRARVRWAEELKSVKSFEVDNSVYISIEYARPFVGWLCLVVAVATASFDGVIDHYYLASGVAPFASATWAAIAQIAIAAVLCAVHLAVMGGLSRSEKRYLTTTSGWGQAAIVSGMFVLMSVATQSAAHMTHETRPFTLSAVHPLLIAGFGMVFKNTVFYQEIAGITLLLIGIGMAMLPADIRANRWWYAEVVALSYGIFAASFLFACTRARARIPIPVLFASMSGLYIAVQLAVARAQGCTFDTDGHTGIGGFVQRENVVAFAFTAAFAPVSWVCYLLALRFLPPVTVSAAMVIRPILSCFGVHLAFHVSDDTGPINPDGFPGARVGDRSHEHRTPFWKFLSQEGPPPSPIDAFPPGPAGLVPPTPSPLFAVNGGPPGATLPPQLAEIMRQYERNKAQHSGGSYPSGPGQSSTTDPAATVHLFSPLFAVGAFIAVSACIFVIYTSSIKRQKVELLLRALSKRRKPRDPYKRRRAGGHTSVRTFLPSAPAPPLREAEDVDDDDRAATATPPLAPAVGSDRSTPSSGGPSHRGSGDGLSSPVRSPAPLAARSPHRGTPLSPLGQSSASKLSTSPGRSLGDSAVSGSPPFAARTPPSGRRVGTAGSDLSTSPKWLTPPRASADDTTVGTVPGSSGRQTAHSSNGTGGSNNNADYYDDW